METYNKIIEIIDANLIFCLIPIILTLILVELFFKNRFETRKALNLIRWTIIIYTITTFIFYLVEMVMNKNEHILINRGTGRYAWAYWTMLLSASILPFMLLVKKIATNFWYVLLVAFCMKIGVYFERFVIISTSLYRDYTPDNRNTKITDSMLNISGVILLQGVVITIIILGILEITKKRKTVHDKGFASGC